MTIPVAIAALLLATQLSVPMSREEKAEIKNMYLHMREVQAIEEAKPQAAENPSGAGFATHRTFPFEAYDHLETADLMRALKEGIEQAREELKGGEPAALLRAETENIQFVLEYFPIIATENDAFERLRFSIQDTNEALSLRVYLLKQFIPGAFPASLFQKYMKDISNANRDVLKRLFGDMIYQPQEIPEVRELAMEALWHTLYEPYLRLFLEDPNVEKRIAETGSPLTPRAMIDDPALQLTNRTSVAFKEQTADFSALAGSFGEQLEPNKDRPESTQAKAREMIQRILDEIPVANRDEIKALLDPNAAPAQEELVLPEGFTLMPLPTPGATPGAEPAPFAPAPVEPGVAFFEPK